METASAFIASRGDTFPDVYDTDQEAGSAIGAELSRRGIDMICE